jgi:REP element-mobilizing transposase RayT
MKYDPNKHHRRSIRLKGYDYSQAGAYFVTIVAYQRECLFGEIADEEMVLNEFGMIVDETWQWLENQYSYVESGTSVVMPNHFHGILIMRDDNRRGDSRIAPTVKRKPLGRLIGAFKTVSTKQINLLRDTEGQVVWQRNYYACPERRRRKRIIRDEREMDRIHRYIESNPFMWADDEENPANIL